MRIRSAREIEAPMYSSIPSRAAIISQRDSGENLWDAVAVPVHDDQIVPASRDVVPCILKFVVHSAHSKPWRAVFILPSFGQAPPMKPSPSSWY